MFCRWTIMALCGFVYINRYAYAYAKAETYTYTDTCAIMCVYTYLYIYIYTYIYMYTDLYTHIHMHTFIHSYIHTLIRSYVHTFIHTLQYKTITWLPYVMLFYVMLHYIYIYLCHVINVLLVNHQMLVYTKIPWFRSHWPTGRHHHGKGDGQVAARTQPPGVWWCSMVCIHSAKDQSSDFFAHLYMLFLVKTCGWFIDVIGL